MLKPKNLEGPPFLSGKRPLFSVSRYSRVTRAIPLISLKKNKSSKLLVEQKL